MIKHFLHSAGTNLIIVCISIILGIINARVLQAEGKGTVAVYMSVYSIIYALTNLGVRQSSSYYFSKENMDIRDILGVHAISIFLGFFITTTSLLLIFFYLEILNINIFVCFVFIVPLALYTTYTTSFALSNKWIERLNKTKLINPLSFFVGLLFFYFIIDKKTVESYFFSQLFAYFITAVYVYSWARKIDKYSYRLEDFKRLWNNSKKIILKGITYALPLFIYGINYKVDILILNNLPTISKSDIGVYSLGVVFAEMIWQIPAILSMIIFSYSVSNKKEREFSNDIWLKNKKIMLVLIPIIIIYALAAKFFIPILFGNDFLNSYLITFLLLPGTYAIVSFNLLNADLAARGYPSVALIIFSIFAIINILLNHLLVPICGINGAAIASSISYIGATICYVFRYYKLSLT